MTATSVEVGKRWPIGTVRYVHAQRARKLRHRREDVRYSHRSHTGRAIYMWFPNTGLPR